MKKKILVADDEPDIVRTLSIMLETEGFDVITAINGQEALDKTYTANPDLLIVDVVLPGINGKEVAAKIKKDATRKGIPVILITAETQKKDLDSLKHSAADCFVIKPFDLYALRDKIIEMLKAADKRRE